MIVDMRFPVSLFRVEGDSMEPSLHNGDYVVLNRLSYLLSAPKKGDIVVLKSPVGESIFIKRITKTSGRKRYFVEGDNKKHSVDSRHFGPVSIDKILGKVIFRIK